MLKWLSSNYIILILIDIVSGFKLIGKCGFPTKNLLHEIPSSNKKYGRLHLIMASTDLAVQDLTKVTNRSFFEKLYISSNTKYSIRNDDVLINYGRDQFNNHTLINFHNCTRHPLLPPL